MTTKEELQKKVGSLEAEIEKLKETDSYRRKEISHVFGRYHDDGRTSWASQLGHSNTIMSWETILVEIGKYIGRDEYAELMREKERMRMMLDEVQPNE